jgi:uracil phosphoribosyltransferase
VTTTAAQFPSLHVLEHPLIRHKLTLMRDKRTPTIQFRQLLREIALLMGYEITRDLPVATERIETPLTTIEAPLIAGKKVAVVSILRAGLGMADGLQDLIPSARMGHIGLYRDPQTKRPVEYFVKLPEPEGRLFILCDPMLATGHSAVAAVDILNRRGVGDAHIRLMALVAAPEGMRVFTEAHPTIPVYAAALDDHLNDHAYIVPGLGDAGDRLFGTK